MFFVLWKERKNLDIGLYNIYYNFYLKFKGGVV